MAEFPDFDGLTSLRTLSIVDAHRALTLPSFEHVTHLTNMELVRRNAVCCDGYLTGVCNLTDYQCRPRAGEINVTCTSARISDNDVALFNRIGATICSKNLTADSKNILPTAFTSDELCGGQLYKECAVNGTAGICFNERMQVVRCITNPEYITLRRLQVARGIGDRCDPAVEAWLGCASIS